MQDKIGVFDSGVGGLTVVKALEKYMPKENIIYFGDTEHMPYGGRSFETIEKFALSDINFLLSFDVKAIIVACGTVSSVVLPHLKNRFKIPIIGMVEPGAAAAAKATKNGRIGILATAAAIKTKAYEEAILKHNPSFSVYGRPAPLFVPLVENGRFKRGDKVAELVVSEYLEELLNMDIDTLLLGCTHYPFLTDIIDDVCKGKVTIVNPAEEAVILTQKVLNDMSLSTTNKAKGKIDFYVSSDIDSFKTISKIFLECDHDTTPTLINIDNY